MLAKSPDDFGLQLANNSLLRIANTNDYKYLLQAELKAIQAGLKFVDEEDENGRGYKGYVNNDNDYEGVGIGISAGGDIVSGEFHLNKLHGSGKIEDKDGNLYWG